MAALILAKDGERRLRMAAENLLKSWNDTQTRREIVDFVQSVGTEGSASFATPAERVAVFDNAGTLWSEKAIPIQLDFTLFGMAELTGRDLEANGFTTYIGSGGDRNFMRPFAGTLYGIPPERVIGSALGLDFDASGEGTQLMYKSEIEFAYTAGAEDALNRAKADGWTVISVKDDWRTVFADR